MTIRVIPVSRIEELGDLIEMAMAVVKIVGRINNDDPIRDDLHLESENTDLLHFGDLVLLSTKMDLRTDLGGAEALDDDIMRNIFASYLELTIIRDFRRMEANEKELLDEQKKIDSVVPELAPIIGL